MNTGSVEEQDYLANINRIANNLARIATALEILALRDSHPDVVRGMAEWLAAGQ